MTTARLNSSRLLWLRRGLLPALGLLFGPKCLLCVLAWAVGLAGLGICGPGMSWSLLAAVASRRLGISPTLAVGLGAALSGALAWWLLAPRRPTRRSGSA